MSYKGTTCNLHPTHIYGYKCSICKKEVQERKQFILGSLSSRFHNKRFPIHSLTVKEMTTVLCDAVEMGEVGIRS